MEMEQKEDETEKYNFTQDNLIRLQHFYKKFDKNTNPYIKKCTYELIKKGENIIKNYKKKDQYQLTKKMKKKFWNEMCETTNSF